MEFDDQSGYGFGSELVGEANFPAQSDADIDTYSLTIGEASSLMVKERCKFASNRKVQRMCRDGVIDCHKLQTTRNGQPVSEWLVNETSLLRHIKDNEIKWDEGEQDFPPVNGDAKAPTGGASQTPIPSGDARKSDVGEQNPETVPNAVALPNELGDAGGGTQLAQNVDAKGDAVATPDFVGDASKVAFGDTRQEVGETRSLASVLIENAKLTAQLEGAHDLIAEVRDDKEFLRDELTEARAGRKDVTAIAERMLETLETIAIGGKLMPGSRAERQASSKPPPAEQVRAAVMPEDNTLDQSLPLPEVKYGKDISESKVADASTSVQRFVSGQSPNDPTDSFRI